MVLFLFLPLFCIIKFYSQGIKLSKKLFVFLGGFIEPSDKNYKQFLLQLKKLLLLYAKSEKFEQ